MTPQSETLLTAHKRHTGKLKPPFVFSGGAAGGRPLSGVPSVRPSAVEQSASEAARLQLGQGTRTNPSFDPHSYRHKVKKKLMSHACRFLFSPVKGWFGCSRCVYALPFQISHLQRVLEAVVAVPALWEVVFIMLKCTGYISIVPKHYKINIVCTSHQRGFTEILSRQMMTTRRRVCTQNMILRLSISAAALPWRFGQI